MLLPFFYNIIWYFPQVSTFFSSEWRNRHVVILEFQVKKISEWHSTLTLRRVARRRRWRKPLICELSKNIAFQRQQFLQQSNNKKWDVYKWITSLPYCYRKIIVIVQVCHLRKAGLLEKWCWRELYYSVRGRKKTFGLISFTFFLLKFFFEAQF